jgi:hypothetical protein
MQFEIRMALEDAGLDLRLMDTVTGLMKTYGYTVAEAIACVRHGLTAGQELGIALNELGSSIDRALGLTRTVAWVDRQLRRWPRLYAWLSR